MRDFGKIAEYEIYKIDLLVVYEEKIQLIRSI